MQLQRTCAVFLISLGTSVLAIGAEPHDTPAARRESTIRGMAVSGSAANVLPIADPAIGREGIAAPKLDADPKTFDLAKTIRGFVDQVEKNHLEGRPLDDRRAARWFDRFLDDLDPQRMYFLQADYAEIQPFRARIVDLRDEATRSSRIKCGASTPSACKRPVPMPPSFCPPSTIFPLTKTAPADTPPMLRTVERCGSDGACESRRSS